MKEHPVIGEQEQSFPDMIVPILGWRSWRVKKTRQGPVLHALHQKGVWPAKKPLLAHCAQLKHGEWQRQSLFKDVWVPNPKHPLSPPVTDCMCGIHAGRSLWWTIEYSNNPNASIFGTCMMWGKVLQHKKGYRSQYAYPHQLFAIPNRLPTADKTISKLESAYGLKIKQIEDWSELVDLVAGPWQREQSNQLAKILQDPE